MVGRKVDRKVKRIDRQIHRKIKLKDIGARWLSG